MVLWKYNMFSLNFNIFLLISMYLYDADQFNIRVNGSKSAFLWHILIVYLAYIIDCVAVQKLHVFFAVTTHSGLSKHVLHRNICGNLMLTLQSCFSNNFLTSWDKYLNFIPNYFKLSSLSDDITFVYVNWVIVIGPEHPVIISLHTCVTFDKHIQT